MITRLVFCSLLLLVGPTALSDEVEVPLNDVPKAGLAAVKAMFPAAEVKGAAKETEGGNTVFEVTLKEKGRTIDVTVGTTGAIELIEREISASELPAAVRKAIDSKYPKATLEIVEEVSSMKDGKPHQDFFEAQIITSDKTTLEVQVLPNGKIKAEEKK